MRRKPVYTNPGHARRLADILNDYFGTSIQVELNIGAIPSDTETPAMHQARVQQEHKTKLLQQLREDPIVQSVNTRI